MGPTLFIMAILGCGDDAASCRRMRVADALYPSMAACEAASGDVLRRNSDIDYPVVSAECRAEKADHARLIRDTGPRG